VKLEGFGPRKASVKDWRCKILRCSQNAFLTTWIQSVRANDNEGLRQTTAEVMPAAWAGRRWKRAAKSTNF
jgi:hypothetical protein